jgi:hypothetical protein
MRVGLAKTTCSTKVNRRIAAHYFSDATLGAAFESFVRACDDKVDRIEALPKIVRDIGWKAQVRLCARYRRLSARAKNANVVNIAIAREMVGFIWSIACTIQSAPRTA